MRKLVFLALFCMLSCAREELSENACDERPHEPVTFSVCIERTKFLSPGLQYEYEKAVNDVRFFVFDSRGQLEAEMKTSGENGRATVTLTYGRKQVRAFANFPEEELENIRTVEDLSSVYVPLSANSMDSASGFPMAGKKDIEIPVPPGEISVCLERLVSRVALGEVKNALSGSLAEENVVLKCVFLSNLLGDICPENSSPGTSAWRNRFGRSDTSGFSELGIGDVSDSFCGALTWNGIGRRLGPGESAEFSAPLYFFPNGVDNMECGYSDVFTKRPTRLVLAAEIKGNTYYYPVNLSSVRRNESANVNLTITHLGSLDPDMFSWAEELHLSKSTAKVVNGVDDAVVIWDEGLSGEKLEYTVDASAASASTNSLSWELKDTLWQGKKGKALRFKTMRPIDGLNPLDRAPDCNVVNVSVGAVNSSGVPVSMPAKVSVMVYHEAFPIRLFARQDQHNERWSLYASGNNPLGLGFKVNCTTYKGQNTTADYSFSKNLVRYEGRTPDDTSIGETPVLIGEFAGSNIQGGRWIDLEFIPVTGRVVERDNPYDLGALNVYETKEPRFTKTEMYMGEGTMAFFGPGPNLSPGNTPSVSTDFAYSYSVIGEIDPLSWKNFYSDLVINGTEVFRIDENATGWNRSLSYKLSGFEGCPFYFVNGGLDVYNMVIHSDRGAIMSDDGRIGVEIYAFEPGRDLGMTSSSSHAVFGALIGIQRRVIGGDHTWLAWKSFDYNVYLTINGCSSWPGTGDGY